MDEKNRLNLKNKLYQKTLFKDVKYVANGGSIKAPIVIDLDPTTLCNLACPECISTSVLNTHYFTEKRLSELAYEFASLEVRAVILIGGGEPLLHSGTPKAIQILASNGIRVGLVTNGTLLDKYLDTIAEYVNWTRVSVDAGTPETYQMFRPSKSGKNTFHKVISNMEKTIKLAKGVVGYSFLIMTRRDLNGNIAETNIQEIYTACRIAKEIGCKYFEVKAMMDINHFIHRQNLDTIESIKEQLYLINQLKTDKFEVVYSSTLSSILDSEPSIQVKDYHTCSVSKLRTLVTPLGVYTCAYHRGNPKAYLGNVVNESFADIWGRADQSCINPSLQCQFHCARHLMNLEILSIGSGNVDNTITDDYDFFI